MSGVIKPKRHRDRASVVCSACKKKKIKCDRQKPCSNCIKASSINSCNFNYEVKRSDTNDIQIIEGGVSDINDISPSSGITNNNSNYSNTNTIISNIKPWTYPMKPSYSEAPQSPSSQNKMLHFSLDSHNDGENLTGKSSIFDIKFDLHTNHLIFRKPSRTFTSMEVLSTYIKQDKLLSIKFILSFKEMLKKESKLWKAKNFRKNFDICDTYFGDTKVDCDNKELNTLVEKMICNNYYAILERLSYFQTELNKILFNSYIPMGVIQLIFHHYFSMKREGIVFKKPKKNFEYGSIALITSLVELTNIFTRYDNSIFNFPLTQNNNDFNELSVLLLNASNYKRKCSIFAVYTLLNLRFSLMIYGDAQSAGMSLQNTYPLFQSAVNICIEMGLNVDQDKVSYIDYESFGNISAEVNELAFAKEIPVESIKALWNQLLIIDASYYTVFSSFTYIDDRFNHGFYQMPNSTNKATVRFVTVIREVSLTFLGKNKRSFRELFEALNKITNLLSSFESFDDFELVEKNEDKWETFAIKFKLLRLLSRLLYYIFSLIGKENITERFSADTLNDERNKEILEILKHECTIKCKLIYFIALNTILKISKSNLKYKFLHYNREIFSAWIGLQAAFFVNLVVNQDMEDQKKKSQSGIFPNSTDSPENFKLPEPPVFETKALEDALYDYNISKHSKLINYVESASKPSSVISLLSLVYEKLLEIPILFSDYKFFIMTKMFIIGIYFLYCYLKVHCEKEFVINENFGKLKTLTSEVISRLYASNRLSHLAPAEQIMTDLDENQASDKTKKNICNAKYPNQTSSIGTINGNANTQTSNFDIPSVSQINDITSSIFDDEAMMFIFNDIEKHFNSIFTN